jgi:hypothetical protein
VNSRFWHTTLLAPERLARGRFDDVLKRVLRPVLVAKQDLPTLISNDQPSPPSDPIMACLGTMSTSRRTTRNTSRTRSTMFRIYSHEDPQVCTFPCSVRDPADQAISYKYHTYHTYHTIPKRCQDKVTTSGIRFWWGRRLPLSANAK